MSLNTIKPMLELVPEVYEHVKTAHVEEPYSTATKETTLLSALSLEYAKLPGVETPGVDIEKIAQVERAVDMYGLKSDLEPFKNMMHERYPAGTMTKEAAAELGLAEQILETEFCGFDDIEKTASKCQELYDAFGDGISSDKVLRHAGVGYLDKDVAVLNLMGRYQRTGNEGFSKVAKVIHNTDVSKLDREDICNIGNVVTGLDKEAGLVGFDFFEECLIKEAALGTALKVNLGTKTASVESIIAIAPDLDNIMGKDISDSLSGDPYTVKAVAESLPADLKMVLSRHI